MSDYSIEDFNEDSFRESHKRFVFVETPDYLGMVEEINTDDGLLIFGHCAIYNNTPSVLKDIKDQWEQMKEYARSQGVESLYTYQGNKRFCDFLGNYQQIGVGHYDGEEVPVFEFPLYEELN